MVGQAPTTWGCFEVKMFRRRLGIVVKEGTKAQGYNQASASASGSEFGSVEGREYFNRRAELQHGQ